MFQKSGVFILQPRSSTRRWLMSDDWWLWIFFSWFIFMYTYFVWILIRTLSMNPISPRNFVGEGIIILAMRCSHLPPIYLKIETHQYCQIWNPIDFQGQRSRSRSNFYCITSLWTLESTSFNGFWLNLVHN
jgi:hypothetical protein